MNLLETDGEVTLYTALKWWESKRLAFNLIVGFIGILALSIFATHFTSADVTAITIYGIVANIFYSTGFLLEAFDLHYFKNRLQLQKLRYPFLLIGTLLSSALTAALCAQYYVPILWN